MQLDISSMITSKWRGPHKNPWGNPVDSCSHSPLKACITIIFLRPCGYFLIKLQAPSDTPHACSLIMRRCKGRGSKALLRSINIMPTCSLQSRAYLQSLTSVDKTWFQSYLLCDADKLITIHLGQHPILIILGGYHHRQWLWSYQCQLMICKSGYGSLFQNINYRHNWLWPKFHIVMSIVSLYEIISSFISTFVGYSCPGVLFPESGPLSLTCSIITLLGILLMIDT